MSADNPAPSFGFSFDTEIMVHRGNRARITTVEEIFSTGKEVLSYGMSFEGDMRITPIDRPVSHLNQELMEVTVNHTIKVKLGLKQQLYNEHGVLYRVEELHIGQKLGGVTPHMRMNLEAVGEEKIHRSTGYFVVTDLKLLDTVENLYSVVAPQYRNVTLACGLIGRTH